MGVCEGVGVTDAVAVAVAVEEALDVLVGEVCAEAVEEGDARTLPEAGALPTAVPELAADRVEVVLPVGGFVAAAVGAPEPVAGSDFVGLGSPVTAGEAEAFLVAPAELLAAADATAEGESRDPVASAEAVARADATPLGEAAIEDSAEALPAMLLVALEEAAAVKEGRRESEDRAVCVAGSVPAADAVALSLARAEAVAMLVNKAVGVGHGTAEKVAEAASVCEAVPDELVVPEKAAVGDRLSREEPVTRAVAVAVRKLLPETEGDEDTDDVGVLSALTDAERSEVADWVLITVPLGDTEVVMDAVSGAEAVSWADGLAASLVEAVPRAVGAEERLLVGVVPCVGDTREEREGTGEAVSFAADALIESETSGERDRDGVPVLESDVRDEAVAVGTDGPDLEADGESAAVTDTRLEADREDEAEAELRKDTERAPVKVGTTDGDTAEETEAERQTVVDREMGGVKVPVGDLLTSAEGVNENTMVTVTGEVPVGGAGEEEPEGLTSLTEREEDGEPDTVRDVETEGVPVVSALPLRDTEALVVTVNAAEAVAADAVFRAETVALTLTEPKGVPVGARPESEGDAD